MKKSDILRAVLFETAATSKPSTKKRIKRSSASEPWKLVVTSFNEAYYERFSVAGATGPGYRLKQQAQTILDATGNDVDKAQYYVRVFVEKYDKFPFINLKKYPRPFLGAVAPFLPQVEQFLSTQIGSMSDMTNNLGSACAVKDFLDDF